MLFDYDALIVGAGPAGCAAAYDLARAGRRVLLLDKRSFPRHKACACGLTRKTLKAIRYSVEPVLERHCRDVVLQEAGPAFRSGRRSADKSCEVRVRLRQPFCAMAVRERFDAFCLNETLAVGPLATRAHLRKIEGIVALRELRTHIELDVTLPGGTTETLRAPALIGADGSNGQTRRLSTGLTSPSLASNSGHGLSSRSGPGSPACLLAGVEAEGSAVAGDGLAEPEPRQTTAANLPAEPAWYARGFALEATVPYTALPAILPAGDAPQDLVFDFAPIAGGYGWLFPKGDHINIGVGGFVPQAPTSTLAPSNLSSRSAAEGSAVTSDGEAEPEIPAPATGDPAMLYETVTRALLARYTQEKLGVDLTTLASAHVTGQHLGLGGHAYTPHGRILLTGDAAGLVDPLTGEGIHSALISGQAAAAAILEALPAQNASSRPEAQPERRDPRIPPEAPPTSPAAQAAATAEAQLLAAAYTRHLQPLQETLAFSHRAARSFYREPERGFRVMRTPLLRNLVLKTYADGLPTTKLLASLARRVA